MKEIMIPKKLAPLVKAFSADEPSAKLLIIEAIKTINKAEPLPKSYDFVFPELEQREPTEEEVEGVVSLMKNLNPQDTLDMIYCAQIIIAHFTGSRLLNHDHRDDQALGLKLLRFCNEAMAQLQKKRSGGVINQNINVIYNHAGSGPTVM